jgi:SAM-dependent methyltransferase
MPSLFACTLFLSAALLMMIQPLCARLMLPVLGGTPNVWNTCMLFFQTGLLLGYVYAHWNARWLMNRWTAIVQIALLTSGFWLLPIQVPRPSGPPEQPLLWLLGTLGAAIAVPYIVLAGTGPLLQRWFAAGNFGNPYFLYAASNAGSFAGLLAYPLAIEPWLTLDEQSDSWRWGYVMLMAMTVACGLAIRRSPAPVADVHSKTTHAETPINWPQRLRWLLLALTPSSLLLSVTNYVTSDLAAVPLLWIVPLALYLLTFTLVFASRQIIPHEMLVRFQPLAVVVLMLLLLREATTPLLAVLALHLLGFFWLALVCHGELARSKPPPAQLTEFYFWLALGGALGGAFNTLVAPMIFTGYAEYPLFIAVAAALKPSATASRPSFRNAIVPALLGAATAALILLSRYWQLEPTLTIFVVYAAPLVACYLLQHNSLQFGLAVAAVLLASWLDPGIHGPSAYRTRSFFGVHRVTELNGMRRLIHGNTVHGQQFLDPLRRREPLTYYHRTGPIGQLLIGLRGDPRLDRVGVVGLGAGSLAAYAEKGQRWTFFEIDPAVAHIARDTGLFTFLGDSRAKDDIDIVLGDARLTLQQTDERFGLLVIDAFGSDAIPWHLLTREALELYRSRLQPGGVLAFHISNRYVDLEPVLANHAHAWDWYAGVIQDQYKSRERLNEDNADDERFSGKMESIWLFLAVRRERLGPLNTKSARVAPNMRAWSDDFTNLLQVLRWKEEP